MNTVLWLVIIMTVLVVVGVWYLRFRTASAGRSVKDAQAEARRWVERLGGQVYSLDPKDVPAARQALADAAERFTAASGQVQQAASEQQYRLAQQSAFEGLYYVRAARISLGIDPGPDLPQLPGQRQAGEVSEDRFVTIEGHDYRSSSHPGDRTRYYHPGGLVAGRPVPQGWYSEPWWSIALETGAWTAGSYLVTSSLLYGMAGVGWSGGYDSGQAGDPADQNDGGGEYVNDLGAGDVGAASDF
jgi:hypothetical protein